MRWHLIKQTLWLSVGITLTGVVPACQSPEDKRPDNLIPEDRMASILTEIHMAESRVTRLSLRSIDSSHVAYRHVERQIFQKFKVDTAAYSKSYAFYASHPRDMEVIYKQVVENLKKKLEVKKPTRS